jgi:hypothetical protein
MSLIDLTPTRSRMTEFVATAVLSLAGVATSWSGYQASLWSGIQAMHYSRASSNRVAATREFTAAGQVASVDVSLFMAWVDAYASGDGALEKFHRARFRKEFEPAFEEWLAARPMQNPGAESTPFTLRSYRVAHREAAQALEVAAEKEFREGQLANDTGDNYVLATVILAVVLFFAGISQQFRIYVVRLLLLGIATVLLVAGSIMLIGMPRA